MAWRQVETRLDLFQNTRKFGVTVLFLAILATGQFGACLVRPALAQSYGAELGFLSLPVETVTVAIANPRSDQTFNDRVTDGFRSFLAVYPGDRFNENAAAFAIARVRRNPDIADVTYSYALGRAGGLDVTFTITLAADGSTFSGRGYLITSNMADLPVLYDRDGTYVRAKLEALSLYYGNNNAWYGQPDAMLAGNPLVQGKPAGSGYSNWAEGYLHYGLYGITPLSDKFYVYGGLSSISSGSTGQELFTDQTRGYTHVEDAYAGFVTGTTDEKGNRLVFNFSAGRQKFTLADALLIANTAANGWDRAALQANARWAADLLVLGQVSYNGNKLEAFYLKPDELPVIDTHTELAGLNLETRPVSGMLAAASYITCPEVGLRLLQSRWHPAWNARRPAMYSTHASPTGPCLPISPVLSSGQRPGCRLTAISKCSRQRPMARPVTASLTSRGRRRSAIA